MKLQVLTANPFQVNTYIISNSKNHAIIIDPACSNEAEQLYFTEIINKQGITPVRIYLTHGHIDHILGCGFMQQLYNIEVYAHKDTEVFIQQASDSADLFGLEMSHLPVINNTIEHLQKTGIDEIEMTALHAPGHAAGSFCYYLKDHNIVFTGDVLFMQSIGRTDLPTGDMDTLLESIRQQLFTLPPTTVVYPGHGPSTTIEDEMNHNPFL